MNQETYKMKDWIKKLKTNIKSSNSICKTIINRNITNIPQIKQSIQEFPKCMFVMSRPLCKCKKKCLTHIRKIIEPSLEKCSLYDKTEVFTNVYLNCTSFKKAFETRERTHLLSKYDSFEDKNIHESGYMYVIELFCVGVMQNSDFECYIFAFRKFCMENEDCFKFKEYLRQSSCKLNKRHLANYLLNNILISYSEMEQRLYKRSVSILDKENLNFLANNSMELNAKKNVVLSNFNIIGEYKNSTDFLKNARNSFLSLKKSDISNNKNSTSDISNSHLITEDFFTIFNSLSSNFSTKNNLRIKNLPQNNITILNNKKFERVINSKPLIVLDTEFYNVVIDKSKNNSKPHLVLVPKQFKIKRELSIKNQDLNFAKPVFENDDIRYNQINFKELEYNTNQKLVYNVCGGLTISAVILCILLKYVNISRNVVIVISLLVILLNFYSYFILAV